MKYPMYRCPDCGERMWGNTDGIDTCRNCRGLETRPRDRVPGGLPGRMLVPNVRFTIHAERRWDQRAPTGAVNPEDAWKLAVKVPSEKCTEITTKEGDTPDRVRVFRGKDADHEQYSMVFICSDTPNPLDSDKWTNIVTCYLAESVPDPSLQRYFESLAYDQEVIA